MLAEKRFTEMVWDWLYWYIYHATPDPGLELVGFYED